MQTGSRRERSHSGLPSADLMLAAAALPTVCGPCRQSNSLPEHLRVWEMTLE